MNSVQKRMMCVAMVSALGGAGVPGMAQAATLSIGNMTITSGSINLNVLPGVETFDFIGPNTNLVGGYIGSGWNTAQFDANGLDPGAIAAIDIGALVADGYYDMNFYTAAASLGTNATPPGTFAGGPVPSGTVDTVAGTITFDMTSFFMYFSTGPGSGYDTPQGGIATGTWNQATHQYSVSWTTSVPLNAPTYLLGTTSIYTLTGIANPVPLPGAAWLLGSGVLGLAAVARRKRVRV